MAKFGEDEDDEACTACAHSIKSARIWVDNTKVRAVLFGLYKSVLLIKPKALEMLLMDLPGLLFFSTYTLLVLFWAEIYHQARSLPTDKLRPAYYIINGFIYFTQLFHSYCSGILDIWWKVVYHAEALPIESRGRQKKLEEAQDDVRTTQNSGVYLLAHTMQVASAKDKNPILSNMGFYGVIQEIWDLDYQKFTIPVFRCDWIDSSGLVVDELGFTLVDLSKIGHRNDQFVLASQVKQIFFVDDPMHRGWSVVLSMPNREYNDVIGDEVLGDVIIECEPFTRGMPNVDTFDELVGELGGQNIRDGVKIYGLNDAYVIGSV
ncbi:hypothetical protein Prudu_021556 [Prunus dulcis]|uniref:DUF4216 domain-containing protein n=1 Tax=Prunus dulcis TaxID=3755 RepID=A0A4Y1RZ11_PRUDU|nr:hypothetical protein Prudu_021556 [Prunus dulcis]